MSTNDLQALFANIKPRSRDASAHPPTALSTPSNPHPPPAVVNSSSVPNGSQTIPASVGESGSSSASSHQPPVNDAAKSLLNLLNFSSSADQQAAHTNTTQPEIARASSSNSNPNPNPITDPSSSRVASASDLGAKTVNSSSGPAQPSVLSPSPEDRDAAEGRSRTAVAAETPQDALFKLLIKSKPNSASRAASTEFSGPRSNPQSVAESPKPSFQPPPQPFPQATAKTSLPPKPEFTYTHPIEPLPSSRQQTPKASSPQPVSPRSPIFKNITSDTAQKSIEIPEGDSPPGSPADQLHLRRLKLTPRSAVARAERLTRENSRRSSGAIDPISTDENLDLPPNESSAELGKENIPTEKEKAAPGEVDLASATSKNPFQVAKDDTPGTTVQQGNPSVPASSEPPSQTAAKETTLPAAPQSVAIAPVTLSVEGDTKKNLENAADEWEDAEDESPQEEDGQKVPVFNFPIKPFVSISLKLANPSDVGIRPDGVMEISRFKKDFDQLDRSLAAATSKFIAYALIKNGGIRVIRQDDGSDRQIFKNSLDRIFNISFCSSSSHFPLSGQQSVLGTGISGSVYYATLSKDGLDLFENDGLDRESLVFPPWPPADEAGPSAVLKTRARRSSRHPEYFAIGRGKSIHLVWPASILNSGQGLVDSRRHVDMSKLYQERNVQIAIGKAGKDFVFSDDDSVIASLDKTGRLRFWDIRELTASSPTGRVGTVKLDTPLLTLLTASPSEKSWPTSVLFVDKLRPYQKGGSLRYVLIGLRQNHTLQLWDLALGKAVQELNFPHETESDAICSVCYSPNSCIIVVGHPTRNSIFFIHLSAPRHTLSSSLSQASYIQRIAAKDPELPRPDSTACMSGITEMSFASKGQLRSVELLPIHKAPDAPKPTDNKAPQFELYVAHSRGVTCLTITKEDLGWDVGSKPIHTVDALQEGLIEIKDLHQATVTEEAYPTRTPPEEAPQPSAATTTAASSSKKKKSKKGAPASEAVDTQQQQRQQPLDTGSAAPNHQAQTTANTSSATVPQSTAADTGLAKESKKLARKAPISLPQATAAELDASRQLPAADQEDGTVSFPTGLPTDASSSAFVASTKSEKVSVGISGNWLEKETDKIRDAISKEFKREMGILRANIQQDRVVLDTSASARQEAVMRLVSQSLADNVERTLGDIVNAQIQQVVLPTVSNATAHAIRDEMRTHMARSLHELLPRELGAQLPAALKSTLFNQSFHDSISHKVAKQVETQVNETIKRQVVSTFERLSATVAQQAANQAASHVQREVARLEEQRRLDSARIERLSSIMTGMAETLQSMSRVQIALQEQLLTGAPTSKAPLAPLAPLSPSPSAPVKSLTKEEIEFNEIANLMEERKYEDGSIRWLHSSQQVELFDNLFVRYTPDYLATDVTPLVAFSIAITVSKSLTTNIGARLEWIVAAFEAVDLNDPEIADLSDHAPALLTSLIQKLESLYMTTAEEDSNNPILRQIPPTAKKAKEMRKALSRSEEGLGLGSDIQSQYLSG